MDIRRCFVVTIVVIASLSACGASAAGRLDPLPDTTRPVHYRISITPDIAAAKYSGTQGVRFEVLKPTRDVVLHSVGLEIQSASVDGTPAARIRFDAARERAIFRFKEKLEPGTHELAVRFSGSISDRADEGMFTRTYRTADGVEKTPHFTMLCCIATGRKFVPMWDQTDLKAVFELDVQVPPGLDVVSNMPVAASDAGRVRFRPTPRMSSYLLFFALGELDRIHGLSGATEVGVLVRRGESERARIALDSSIGLIDYYNDYFATPFPLPKLDSVGLPGHAGFGGMENFGSILYSERYLLAGPERSSETELRDSFVIIAHEIAHQWFGDLVTAGNWDDLWLNEGFASWMENKATQHFHPQWQIWMQDGAQPRESALRFDARESSYAIVPNHSFGDAITYSKSAQVLRMIEAYVGEDRFREAMRTHIRENAFGTASSAKVWQTIENAAGVPVADIGRDFTQQKGVPLIDVVSSACAPGSDVTKVVLRQARFALDSGSKAPQRWRVPVVAVVVGSNTPARQIVSGPRETQMEVPGCGAVKINAGETGYFRARYDDASFAQLAGKFGALVPADQLGLLNDTFGLAEAGYVSFRQYLDLAAQVGESSDPMVLFQLATSLRNLDRYYAGFPQQAKLRGVARRKLGAILAHLGWEKTAGESGNVSILRAQLIEQLARFEDPAVIAEARRRLEGEIPAPIRDAVFAAAGAGADPAVFEDFRARAAATHDQAEQRLLMFCAAGANDPAAAAAALQWILDESFPPELIPEFARTVAERHPRLAFDFVTAHVGRLTPRLEKGAASWLVPSLLASANDPRLVRDLEAFAVRHFDAGERRESVAGVRTAMAFRDTVRKQRLAAVDAWLAQAAPE